MSYSHLLLPGTGDYSETRYHDLRKSRMVMVDGSLVVNDTGHSAGTSTRILHNGYWGFASGSLIGLDASEKLADKAFANAKVMAGFGEKSAISLPTQVYRGEHGSNASPGWSAQQRIEWLEAINALCQKKYDNLVSTTIVLSEECHDKHLKNSFESQVLNNIHRAAAMVTLTVEDKEGRPVELYEMISGKGSHADLDLSPVAIEEQLDKLYGHLMAKREAVSAKGGKQVIVLAADLAGMLAHEAMGHPCEADLVLGGAVTGDLRGQRVASELITMVDYAHSYKDEELLMPVYADDEGTPSNDVVMIREGVLTDFMNSRETAQCLGDEPTGNARAYAPDDEPLVRMRNTAILPGTSKLEAMIAGVEEGYYLLKTSNGQADITTEFMFGISMGYEIKNGKLGRAIKDTTLSGSAIDMLRSVDAVSDVMHWENGGYCGKKQPMIVSSGGPALRAVAHLGGE